MSDILKAYTEDVSRYPLLSREDERAVAVRAFAGDELAIERLVNANLRFVIRVAKRYMHQGVPLMDLIQAGNIGLHTAAKKFDPNHEAQGRFISYAVHWITKCIHDELDAMKDAAAPTRTQQIRNRKVWRAYDAIEAEGRNPSVEELVKATGNTRERVEEALDHMPGTRSFDTPVIEGENLTLGEVIGDRDGTEDRIEQSERHEQIMRVLNEVLLPREVEIVCQYHAIGQVRGEMSYSEIAAGHGVCRERIRQIYDRALSKLRKATQHHGILMDYITKGRPEAAENAAPAATDPAEKPAANDAPEAFPELLDGLRRRGWTLNALNREAGYAGKSSLANMVARGSTPGPDKVEKLRTLYRSGRKHTVKRMRRVSNGASTGNARRVQGGGVTDGSMLKPQAPVKPSAQPVAEAVNASQVPVATGSVARDDAALRANVRKAMFDLAGQVAGAQDQASLVAVLADVETLVDRALALEPAA